MSGIYHAKEDGYLHLQFINSLFTSLNVCTDEFHGLDWKTRYKIIKGRVRD
jgi:hypothetical protein